ncbi:hypothetical protein LP421_05185 (plasmid) [Rhizobium sp. RCAM05350]|nr:hypothetical protein LP421_05185 [Rhizobium sp. RCAM05350]
MSKSPRKSIVASFGLLSAELESDQAADQQDRSQPPAPVSGIASEQVLSVLLTEQSTTSGQSEIG